ncbi:hypothetical protein ATO49_15905 [Mycolicibacterium fortuitum subsp. fortuitum DSM 46621 = ATCC 6841 = JCM 6387]|nr:hypothetical protein ATO49_15905 [Mycolicibacterium fortuitum subsp. fortuitum DSM 46621 = ATCC 6841 = JCM 6387]
MQREQTEVERVVQRGTVGVADPGRQFQGGCGVDDGVGGISAEGHRRDAHDASAHQVLGAEPRALDHTDGLHARDERGLQRHGGVAALDDVDVVEVQAEGAHRDPHFTRPGCAHLHGLAFEDLGRIAEGGGHPGFSRNRFRCSIAHCFSISSLL